MSESSQESELGSSAREWRSALRTRTIASVAWLSLGAIAAFHVAMFAYYFFARVRFPLAIDWIEGGGMVEANRLAHGQTIYPTDPATFVPYAYPPVYYAVVALASKVTGGVTFAVGRSISAGAFFGASVLAGHHVQRTLRARESGTVPPAVLWLAVVGLATSGLPTVRGGLDSARVDSLGAAFMALGLVAAAGAVREDAKHRAWRAVAAATLMTLAVYTKQTHLFLGVGVALLLLRVHARTGAIYAVTFVGLVLGAFLGLQALTHGGFAMWMFGMRHHDFLPERLLLGCQVLAISAPHLFLSVGIGALTWKRLSPTTRFWVQATALAIPGALIGFAKIWGEVNNFISLMAIVAVPTVLVVADVSSAFFGAGARSTRLFAGAFAIFLLGRFAEEDHFRPAVRTQERAQHLVDEVAKLDGDVVSPASPFMAHLARHNTPQVSLLAVLDAQASRVPGVDRDTYIAALRAQKPRYLLLTGHPVEKTLAPLIESDYHFVRELEAPGTHELLMTAVPNLLYERNPPRP